VDVKDAPPVDEAQKIAARWIDWGTRIALVLLVTGFFAYVTGIVPPHVAPADLARLWGLPLREFLAASNSPSGWGWLALASRGDYLNVTGVAVLASIVLATYLRILPVLASRARVYAAIAALEILVLLAAASGLLNSIGGG
jgi:hypothetical protein